MLIRSETATVFEIAYWGSVSRGFAIPLPALFHLHSRGNTASSLPLPAHGAL